MKKALCLSASNSGRGDKQKIDNLIKDRLSKVFDIFDFVKIDDIDSLLLKLPSMLGDYDSLIVCGGDGTLNNVINVVAKLDKRPTIGYIPTGTMCDCGSIFGLSRSIKKSIQVIENNYTGRFDLVNVGDNYFVYMASFGAYSSISYETKRKKIKQFHYFAYYFASIKEAFKKTRVNYSFKIEEKTYTGVAPFVLLMNGKKVAGFKINKKSSPKDGVFELYLSKNTIFNGLLSYLPFKISKPIYAKEVEILDAPSIWCLDGERKEIKGKIIRIMPKHISFYCVKSLSE